MKYLGKYNSSNTSHYDTFYRAWCYEYNPQKHYFSDRYRDYASARNFAQSHLSDGGDCRISKYILLGQPDTWGQRYIEVAFDSLHKENGLLCSKKRYKKL